MKEITKRRKKLAEHMLSGGKLSEIAKELADEYDVKKQAIYQDWTRRENWLSDIYDLDEPEKFESDLLVQQKIIAQRLWKLAETADNDNAALGAYRTLMNSSKKHLETLQEIGKTEDETSQDFNVTIGRYKPDGENEEKDSAYEAVKEAREELEEDEDGVDWLVDHARKIGEGSETPEYDRETPASEPADPPEPLERDSGDGEEEEAVENPFAADPENKAETEDKDSLKTRPIDVAPDAIKEKVRKSK